MYNYCLYFFYPGTHSTVSRNEDQQAENLFIDKNIPEIRQVEQRTRYVTDIIPLRLRYIYNSYIYNYN